ncbi:MAG: hypothetical protein V4724_35520 [Pseudomonadota bacterium]
MHAAGFFRRRRLALLLMLGLGSARVAAQAPLPVLVLSGSSDSARAHGHWLSLIYTEALRRLGYRLDYRIYPANRSSIMSDLGEVDGEINRAATYGLEHPDMIRIDPPHFSVAFAAYASRALALHDGWDALKETPLRVEYRGGLARCKSQLSQRVAAERLSVANGTLVGLRKLERARTDLYIDIDGVVGQALMQPEFRNSAIRKVAVMENVDSHAYLHKKHRALAASLSQVLTDMRREGLIAAYRRRAEQMPPMGGEAE